MKKLKDLVINKEDSIEVKNMKHNYNSNNIAIQAVLKGIQMEVDQKVVPSQYLLTSLTQLQRVNMALVKAIGEQETRTEKKTSAKKPTKKDLIDQAMNELGSYT